MLFTNISPMAPPESGGQAELPPRLLGYRVHQPHQLLPGRSQFGFVRPPRDGEDVFRVGGLTPQTPSNSWPSVWHSENPASLARSPELSLPNYGIAKLRSPKTIHLLSGAEVISRLESLRRNLLSSRRSIT